MKRRLIRKNIIGTTLIALLMAGTLTACASTETVEETKETETKVETTTVKEEVAQVEVKEEEPTPAVEESAEVTPESAVEPEAEIEPEPEPIVYEGIDMESTLPGKEWLQTFEGIITEPKIVILSDETGKKQIVENGDIVNLNPDTDYIALYLPGDAQRMSLIKCIFVESIESVHSKDGVTKIAEKMNLDVEETRKYGRQNAALYVMFNGEELELSFDMRPE